jgi:hypothetical protein
VGLLDLAFDARGQGLLSWEAFARAGARRFTAVAVRGNGGWRAAPDLAGIGWGDARIHLYGRTRALLVAHQITSVTRHGEERARLVYALGHSDGAFGALQPIAGDVDFSASAANRRGDAVVVFSDRRTNRTFVTVRGARHRFRRPRRVQPGGVGTVAINDAGTRVMAWWGRDGVYARIRAPGGRWGPPRLAAKARRAGETTVRAAITPGGRIVVAWYSAVVDPEKEPIVITSGVAVHGRSGWRSFRLEHSAVTAGPFIADTTAIPVIDSARHPYVAWTGTAHGVPVAKLARIATGGPRRPVVLSGHVLGAAVDDAAAGPDRSLAVSWSAWETRSVMGSYASVRRSGRWTASPRLTPAGALGLDGSRVAFSPLTGDAVVAWRFIAPDGTGAVGASSDAAQP